MRFRVLDSWRGVAALCVALFHFPSAGLLPEIAFVKHSWLFVDFFFVLSGFVIAHAYSGTIKDNTSFWVFIFRRIGRLWPLHIATLIPLILLEFAKLWAIQSGVFATTDIVSAPFTGSNSVHDLFSNVFLLQGVLALLNHWGFVFIGGWNAPSWTISVEMIASIVFALACLASPKRMGVLAALGVIGSFLWLIVLGPGNLAVSVDFGVARCLLGFCTGYLVYAFYQARKLAVGHTLAELASVVAVIAIVGAASEDALSFAAVPIFALCVYVFAHEGGLLSKLLSLPAPTKLGEYSYSIYLTHYVIVQFLFAIAHIATKSGVQMLGAVGAGPGVFAGTRPLLFGAPWITDISAFGYLALVVLVSSITYRWIETPARNYFNRLAKHWAASHTKQAAAMPIPSQAADRS